MGCRWSAVASLAEVRVVPVQVCVVVAGRVEDHVVVDLVLAALVPAAGEAGDALRFVIAGEVDLGAEEALGLGAGAEVERVGYVDGEVGLL